MAQNNMPIHGPQTGFADITPLPDFSYFSLSSPQIALVCLFVVCCIGTAYFLYKKLRRQKHVEISDPVREAMGKISRLKTLLESLPVENINSQVQFRSIASELAEIIRIFLTKKINFQAIGLTSKEISQALDLSFQSLFPYSSEDILNNLTSSIKQLFEEAEATTYAETIDAGADLAKLISIAGNIVITVDEESQRKEAIIQPL